MIRLENISMTYPAGVTALQDVSLSIEKGEFVFVTGSSGSGKSTLIKLLLCEVKPTKGNIYIQGKNLGNIKRRKLPLYRRKLGVVFQDFRLLKDRNVYENVAFAQRVIGKSKQYIHHQVPQILEVMGLGDKLKAFPNQLSGGEQQRVALARAVVNHPIILLADEPTGNLDPKNSMEIMELLEEINKTGTTVIVVTHNLEIVKAMKKRVITLEKGKIIKDERME